MPPWEPEDAPRHTGKARSAKSKRAFAAASNSVLEKTGDEGRAVAAGNAAVNKSNAKAMRLRQSGNVGSNNWAQKKPGGKKKAFKL